jgi:hypothetical protein
MWFPWAKRAKQTESAANANAGHNPDWPCDVVPSLRDALDKEGISPKGLALAIVLETSDSKKFPGRSLLFLGDGKRIATWHVGSLRALFRGERLPPADGEMAHYPETYVPFWSLVESSVFSFSRGLPHPPTDSEFADLYSQIRRRPDGRSLGRLHDVIWQSAALALGLSRWSEAEFVAVFGQLARSARSFRTAPTSRNYIKFICSRPGEEE